MYDGVWKNVVGWAQRLRRWAGPLWWHVLLLFVVSRLSDIVSFYVGTIVVPSRLSAAELGSLEPLFTLVRFGSVPLAALCAAGSCYLTLYMTRGMVGKLKAVLRDMLAVGLFFALCMSLLLIYGRKGLTLRLHLEMRPALFLGLFLMIIMSALQPLVSFMLQGTRRFYTNLISGIASPLSLLVLSLVLTSRWGLSGYVTALAGGGMVATAVGLGGLMPYWKKTEKPESYYSEWRGIAAFIAGYVIFAVASNLRAFIGPFAIQHFLGPRDAAGYYMVSRFAYLTHYMSAAIGFVAFPFFAEHQDRTGKQSFYLKQTVAVTALIAGITALLVSILLGPLFDLRPEWREYKEYSALVGWICAIAALPAVEQVYTAHEIAGRRFSFLWVFLPVIFLECASVYVPFTWGVLRPWLPGSLWIAIEKVMPRNILQVLVIMVFYRIIMLVGMWAHYRATHWRNPNSPQKILTSSLTVILLLAFSGCSDAKQPAKAIGPVSLDSSLGRLVDPAILASSPRGQSKMVSSFDTTGGNQDWADISKYHVGGGLYVFTDLKGPGCITRIWETYVVADEWMIFVDGESSPRIRVAGDGLFGHADPFSPPLCDVVSQGAYCYMPIPFEKSARVAVLMTNPPPGMLPFFQVGYETYSPGEKVTSFPKNFPEDERRVVADVAKSLSTIPRNIDAQISPTGWNRTSVMPHEEKVLLRAEGSGAISALAIMLDFQAALSATERRQMLRNLVMSLRWDRSRQPSVETPFGDFFCALPAKRQFESFFITVTDRVFLCRFPMPFRRSAELSIRNDSDVAAVIACQWAVQPAGSRAAPIRYFHATWNQTASPQTAHTVLNVKGEGHFAGCFLHAMGMDGSWNILEGDEIIEVDDNPSPIWHGTGLEDYFNGAWYYRGLFARPFHGLVYKAPIKTSQYRFHQPDPIPFRKWFRMTWEMGGSPMNRANGYISSVAFWYAAKPMPAGSSIPRRESRFPPTDPLERQAIMCSLFELERIGRNDEALEECDYYAEKFKGAPDAEMIKLRSLGYRARLVGFKNVRNDYVAFLNHALDAAAVQARTILWQHENTSNSLVAANANGNFRAWFDGKEILNGDHPFVLYVRGMVLQPGEHEICVEVTAPNRPGPHWLAATVQSAVTNLHTDLSWEYSLSRPANWPATSDESIVWKKVQSQGFPPFMAYWQFMPNAFVYMQSGERYIGPSEEWKTGAICYFRKKFHLP